MLCAFLSHWKKKKKGDMKDNATVVDVVSKSIERGEIITWHLFLTKLISHLFPPATHMWLKYKCHYPLVFYNESVMDHKSNFTSALTAGNEKRQCVGPISKYITKGFTERLGSVTLEHPLFFFSILLWTNVAKKELKKLKKENKYKTSWKISIIIDHILYLYYNNYFAIHHTSGTTGRNRL